MAGDAVEIGAEFFAEAFRVFAASAVGFVEKVGFALAFRCVGEVQAKQRVRSVGQAFGGVAFVELTGLGVFQEFRDVDVRVELGALAEARQFDLSLGVLASKLQVSVEAGGSISRATNQPSILPVP